MVLTAAAGTSAPCHCDVTATTRKTELNICCVPTKCYLWPLTFIFYIIFICCEVFFFRFFKKYLMCKTFLMYKSRNSEICSNGFDCQVLGQQIDKLHIHTVGQYMQQVCTCAQPCRGVVLQIQQQVTETRYTKCQVLFLQLTEPAELPEASTKLRSCSCVGVVTEREASEPRGERNICSVKYENKLKRQFQNVLFSVL